MAEFLEDPSVLTKEKLKNELAANNVPLPSGEHKKEVYVQLYLKHLTVLNSSKSPPADTFSSDEELPAPLVSNRSRSGRVRFHFHWIYFVNCCGLVKVFTLHSIYAFVFSYRKLPGRVISLARRRWR